jgi:glucose-1-phosphate thymidylyltransferase
VQVFEEKNADCVLGVHPVSDPSRYGIAELENGRVKRLVEKPKNPVSNLALIGVYVFGEYIFGAAKKIKPSWRNELEITDAIQVLVSEGRRVEVEQVKGWWKDTGTVGDLLEANRLVLDDLKTDIQGAVEDDSSVRGRVSTGPRSEIRRGATVVGPCILGSGATLAPGVYIGPYTSIGNNVVVKRGEIENSIVMDGCQIDTSERIVDSMIGPDSVISTKTGGGPKGKRLVVGEKSTIEL